MSYTYQVLPFRGNVKEFDPNAVAVQLNDLINSQAAKGWIFHEINSVHIMVSPGCLATLFGAKHFPVSYDMAIFKKEEQLSLTISKNQIDNENKAKVAAEENQNSPIVIAKKQKSEPILTKLNSIGYTVLKSKITELSEYWELEYSANGSKFEILSQSELEKFAKNF
jgi:hypothetical protein